jgi:hypothetical protein
LGEALDAGSEGADWISELLAGVAGVVEVFEALLDEATAAKLAKGETGGGGSDNGGDGGGGWGGGWGRD